MYKCLCQWRMTLSLKAFVCLLKQYIISYGVGMINIDIDLQLTVSVSTIGLKTNINTLIFIFIKIFVWQLTKLIDFIIRNTNVFIEDITTQKWLTAISGMWFQVTPEHRPLGLVSKMPFVTLHKASNSRDWCSNIDKTWKIDKRLDSEISK